MSKSFISILLLLQTLTAIAQTGTIKGTVTEIKTKEPLIGATVILKGTTIGTTTDFDGHYVISKVKPGNYTLLFSFISYDSRELPIVVKAGQETKVTVSLKPASIEVESVNVVAKANHESETMLLAEQKNAVLAKQAIGAQEISRKGISDAEAAVAQVSGISKQEGVKNVFVRGLGDRNNCTTFNGFPLPSEDPEYKNISLDFFSSDIIKNIGVDKAFSTNNYNDVGGAAIDISSKQLVGEKVLTLEASAGFNSKTINTDFLKTDGINYLGIANTKEPGSNYKALYNYDNKLDPQTVNLPLNYSYGFSVGKKFNVGRKSKPLTFYLVGNYSTSYSSTEEKTAKIITDGENSENLNGDRSTQNINQLILGNINYMPNKKHEFNYNFLMIHDNNQYVGKYVGLLDGGDTYAGCLIRQQTNDNLLITNQLTASFKLADKFDLEAGISYNHVKGTEPDRKENKLKKISDTEYRPFTSESAHVRTFSELKEDDFNYKFRLSYALPKKFENDASALHVGYNGRYVNDEFNASEYCYNSKFSTTQTLDELSLDSWYNQENLSAGKFTGTDCRNSEYTVSKMINSGYASIDYQINPKFVADIGIGVDLIDINIDYDIKDGQDKDENNLKPNFILPSLNLKYDLTDKHTIRFGASKTYTLPQSKEISPYLYIDLSSSRVGNPKLEASDNYNADLKWDYYISSSELISLTGFYKYIKDPIACTYEGSAGGYYTYKNISDHATVAGAELEIKKSIFNTTDQAKQNKLSAGLNASYIYSNMLVEDPSAGADVKKDCELEGAAPFIVNFDLSYKYSHKDKSFINSLVVNYFSDRIYSIGMSSAKDVIEKGIPTLNFISTTELNKHFSIKFKAKNLLNPEHKLSQDDSYGTNHVLRHYYKGIDLSLGLNYKF